MEDESNRTGARVAGVKVGPLGLRSFVPPSREAETARNTARAVAILERIERGQDRIAALLERLERHLAPRITAGDGDTSTRWTVTREGSLRATYGQGDRAITATLWGSDPFTGSALRLVLSRDGEELHSSEHADSLSALDEAERLGPLLATVSGEG